MLGFNSPPKELYSEVEAAANLGISLTRLYMLLDENVFNEGTPRPPRFTFTPSDLILLRFWNKPENRKNKSVVSRGYPEQC